MIHHMFLMQTGDSDFTCDSCLQKNDLNQTKGQDHEDTDQSRAPIFLFAQPFGSEQTSGYKDLSGSASGQHRVNQPIKLKHVGPHIYSDVVADVRDQRGQRTTGRRGFHLSEI